MDFNLPECVTSTPAEPVALVGLEVDVKTGQGRHAELWKAFTSERSPDRVSLKYSVVESVENLRLPLMNPRRTSYEWFIPKGILKTNWMEKHLTLLPAVIVIFFKLDWNDPDWSEKKAECARRVEFVRASVEGRGNTKLAVVLLQKEPVAALPTTEDATASERAAGLCSACELSARSLFVLATTTPNLLGFVIRLENAFNELAQNYYHAEIRGVKSHRDYLNKTTHLYLFVRHQFKIGFLNELKRDFHTAYKHYQQAYNLLMEVRATDTNIMEVKTVAGFVNFKVCRLAFKLNLPRDAISQFRRHMDIFQSKVGADNLAFEHRGWQAEQSRTFAKLFSDAIQTGLPAIQTQNPGLYYQQAACYAIQRRHLAEELCSELTAYPQPDPLASIETMEFYGQRPWRPGKVAIEPPEMQLEREAICALQHKEKHLDPPHSDVIVDLLRKAIRQFQLFRSPRSESHLTVQMAEELSASSRGGCAEALTLLQPVIDTYRRDGWSLLLKTVLSLALRCAYLVTSVEDYVRFALELAQLSASGGNREECWRIAVNVCRLFQTPMRLPSAEPGLTTNSQRADVENAAQNWRRTFDETSSTVVVELMPEIAEFSLLKVQATFDSCSFRADHFVPVTVAVKNRVPLGNPGEVETCVFPIRAVAIFAFSTEPEQDVVECLVPSERLKWEAAEEGDVLLIEPGKTASKTFRLKPEAKDVRKNMVIGRVDLTLGRKTGFKANIRFNLATTDCMVAKNKEFFPPVRALSVSDEVDAVTPPQPLPQPLPPTLSVVKIDQRKPLLEMAVSSQMPILVAEWFVIEVELTNGETESLATVSVCAVLHDASDPTIADTTKLVVDFRTPEPSTPQTPGGGGGESNEFALLATPPVTQLCENLDPEQRRTLKFYLKASTVGERRVSLTASYSIRSFACELCTDMSFETVEPFQLTYEVLSCRKQQLLTNAFTDEPFLLVPRLASSSGHGLKVIDSWLELRHPVQFAGSVPSQLKECRLYRGSIARECFPLIVKRNHLAPGFLDVQELPVGKYILKWAREDCADHDLFAVSTFDACTVSVCQSTLFATVSLPPCGVVRTPFRVRYEFFNRTAKVQEFVVVMQPNDGFMFSGNKQLNVKILPDQSYELDYVLYPLLLGEAVALPRLELTSLRWPQTTDDLAAALQRLLPTTVTVLPKAKSLSDDDKNAPPLTKRQYEVGKSMILECKLLSSSLVCRKPSGLDRQGIK